MRKGIVAALCLGLLLVACGTGSQPPATSAGSGGGDPDLAPDFTVTTFEGTDFTLSEQRGTPVVLNFWESW